MLKHLAALLLLAAVITPAPSLAQTAATATLAGTVTEANLFAATASTVSVTLTNTEYEAAGTLMQSHFSVTDTVAGTVRVSDVTRDSATVATLTLAYSGGDITAAGTLSVTLAAEGHTGADALTTNTIDITASTGANVCGRTAQVRDGIVRESSATECTSITDLASITRILLTAQRIASLQNGDFAGLSGLQRLFLSRNKLDALPPNIFAGLTALENLGLDGNSLNTLPATIFDGLERLSTLRLFGNPFTADTGLPTGIFDDVLDTLGPIATTGFRGFLIDQTVRDAHFVCSRADAAAIVMATPDVTDCLRISAAQLTAALEDATLSGLTLSDGTDTFPLAPVFASGITTYTASVPNSVISVTVTPTATRSGATITVNGDTVASGNASNAIDLMPGVAVPITIVVTAADGATAETYTVMVTRAAPPPPTATLVGTLTEATLFAAPAPTVTVTLTNTAYEAAGTLMQNHFSVTDTVAGTVSVSGFTRDSDTEATLTLAYSGEDITTTGTLSVTLAAAGHTGTDDLMTSAIAITASAGVNVCGRTAQVRDGIVGVSSATECTSITDLASITRLNLFSQSIGSLQPGDFAGLTALEILFLFNNDLEALPATIFAGLTSLHTLSLPNNDLEALPATIFDGLDRLSTLFLRDNPFTADTGLPAGIFDDVLDTLGAITTSTTGSGFVIDQTVRRAHFVCSRADAAAIVMATTGVTDCLRISAAQLNAALLLVTDATLSGLTLSDGTDTFPLTPPFAPGTTVYAVSVPTSVTSLEVTPTATRTSATITVNFAPVDSGNASNAINLPTPGTAVPIAIEVTAADTTTRMTYMVTATREADATPNFDSALPLSPLIYTVGLVVDTVTLPAATGGDGTLTYTLTPALPAGLTFNEANRQITGTPSATHPETPYTLTATDADASDPDSDTFTFMLTVNPPAPAATLAAPTALTGANLATATVTVTLANTMYVDAAALGPDDFSLADTIAGTVSVSGVTRTSDTVATLALAHSGEAIPDSGILSVTVLASAHVGTGDLLAGNVPITVTNTVPDFGSATVDAQTYTVGTSIGTVTLPSATGGNGTATYALAPTLPSGLTFTAADRTITGTPGTAQAATTYTYTASDNDVDTAPTDAATLTFTITINAANTAPTFGGESIAPQTYTEDASIGTVTLPSATGGNGALTYALAPTLPTGLTFTAADRTITGTPAMGTTQTATAYTYTASDSDVDTATTDTATLTFTITINPAGSDTGPTPQQTEQLHEEIVPQAVQAIAGNVVASVGARIETAIQGAPPTGGVRLDGQSIEGDGKAVLLGFLDEAPEYTRSIKEGTLNWKRMLANSSFSLNAAGDSGNSGLGLWGSGHYTEFNGDDNNLDWDGDSYGFQIGADTRWNNNLLTGLSVSWSEGEVEYIQGSGATREEGDYTLTLVGIHPYLGWSNDSGSLSLWGSVGYADGEVEIEPDGGNRRTHDTTLVSVAGGFKHRLTGFLNVKGDFSAIETDIDESTDVTNDRDLTVDSQRLRLLLEGYHQNQLGGGRTLTQSAEVGYRADGGDSDADTDGAELALGFDYHNPAAGLTLAGKGRVLVGNRDYREWSVSGLIRLQPQAYGQGLTFTMEPGYGGTASEAGELWNRNRAYTPIERNEYGAQMKAHLGYRLNGFVTPYTEVTSGEALRRFRMGVKWQLGEALDLDLFGEQYEAADTDNVLRLEGELRF